MKLTGLACGLLVILAGEAFADDNQTQMGNSTTITNSNIVSVNQSGAGNTVNIAAVAVNSDVNAPVIDFSNLSSINAGDITVTNTDGEVIILPLGVEPIQ